jgi:hypothetical protein
MKTQRVQLAGDAGALSVPGVRLSLQAAGVETKSGERGERLAAEDPVRLAQGGGGRTH